MSYSAQVLADSPVGYWRLTETSGTSAADSSGNSRTGTYSGTYVQGVQGISGDAGNTAVNFTGSGAQVSVPWASAFSYSTTGSLTIECWYKGTAVGTNAGSGTVGSTLGLVCASTDTTNKQWGVTVTDTGVVRFFYGVSYFIVTGTVVVNDGNYHHIAVTVTTGTNYTITIYVDGVVDVTTSSASASAGAASPSITIANNPRAASHVAPGVLDEVAIYPSALSATRVAKHYSVGAGTRAEMTYGVQIDVSGSAFGSAFTATDVSSKAAAGLGFDPLTITWGRQDQYSAVNPTTVDGVFQNSDGTFSPGNASSTYYPRIRRGLRRRVSVGVNGTTVNLSEDYATSIEVVPARDSLAVSKVAGSDILARFGQTPSTSDPNASTIGTTLRSFLAEEMLLDSPSCLYMLQESEGATSFADVTGAAPPLVAVNSPYGAGTVTAGVTPSGTFTGGTMVGVTSPDFGTWTSSVTAKGSWLSVAAPSGISGSNYSIELWIQTPSTPPPGDAAIAVGSLDSVVPGQPVGLCIAATSGVLRFTSPTSGSAASTSTATSICDGLLHHVVATVSAGTMTIYVDGASAASFGTSAIGWAFLPPVTLGMWSSSNGLQDPLTATYSHFAIYPTALSAARVTAHYQAGVTAFAGERTGQRIARLLSYRPDTGSSLDTGLGTMGIQTIAGRSLQDCLIEVGQVESGAVFVDGLGQVNFRSRSRLFNPTPTVTLDMSVGGVDFGSNWREDTQNVINDATVTNSTTGSDQRFADASSINTDGEYSTSYSLPLNSDTDALNLAGWIVVNGTQQQLVATPLTINLLHLTAAQAQAVLSLKPLDCVRLTNCPTPAPASTMTFIVQGGSISLAADAATATLNLTRLPYPVAVWDSTNWDATTATWAF